MKHQLSLGHFGQFGAVADGDAMEFTFEVHSGATPAILLYSIKDKAQVAEITLGQEFSFGRVYSVRVEGYSWRSLCYLLRRDDVVGMDEYAPLVVGREEWMDESRCEANYQVYGGFPSSPYVWHEKRVHIAPEDMILYKLHLRGFTMANGLSATKRGNYRGIIAKLPYLKELGVTTLEFLPIYDFEEIKYQFHYRMDANRETVMVAEDPIGTNFWGYGAASYFAPKASYFGEFRSQLLW